jgi:hypothetical protein
MVGAGAEIAAEERGGPGLGGWGLGVRGWGVWLGHGDAVFFSVGIVLQMGWMSDFRGGGERQRQKQILRFAKDDN